MIGFMDAIQEHERRMVPELKPGNEIGRFHTDRVLRKVALRHGVALMAKADGEAVGFASAWVDIDDDPLLKDEAQGQGYVSDIYVVPEWRRRGVARLLLGRLDEAMRERGCRRMAICSKAANFMAVQCYAAVGYRPYEVILWKPLA